MDIAIFSWIGGREYMEDFHFLIENFNGQEGQIFGGVFDGHGGKGVAKYAAQNIAQYFQDAINSGGSADISKTFKEVYQRISDERDDQITGCTALSFLVRGDDLIVANAGDSRLIMTFSDIVSQVTIDHNVKNRDEINRVWDKGGTIEKGYLWHGPRGLMCTRSLGDHWFDRVGIISEPEVFFRKIPQLKNTFIIAASDGVWDVLGNGAVADLVAGKKTAQEAVDAIISFIKENQKAVYLDNITLIVLRP